MLLVLLIMVNLCLRGSKFGHVANHKCKMHEHTKGSLIRNDRSMPIKPWPSFIRLFVLLWSSRLQLCVMYHYFGMTMSELSTFKSPILICNGRIRNFDKVTIKLNWKSVILILVDFISYIYDCFSVLCRVKHCSDYPFQYLLDWSV